MTNFEAARSSETASSIWSSPSLRAEEICNFIAFAAILAVAFFLHATWLIMFPLLMLTFAAFALRRYRVARQTRQLQLTKPLANLIRPPLPCRHLTTSKISGVAVTA